MDPALWAVLGMLLVVTPLIIIHDRRDKARRAAEAQVNRNKTPEQIKAERLAREEQQRIAAREAFENARVRAGGWLITLGIIAMLIAFWILIVDPGSSGSSYSESVVNLQKLFIGQTLGVLGAIFFAGGMIINFVRTNPP